MDKELSFKIKVEDGEEMRDPVWLEVRTQNTSCPVCNATMVVVLGEDSLLYGFCIKCRKYFLGE